MEALKQKKVYTFDTQAPSHTLIGFRQVEADYQLQPGETFTEPETGQQYWNAETGTWVASTVDIYCYDVNNNNTLSDMFSVPAGTTLKTGQTTVVPKDGLYEPRFNGTTWEAGITEEEFLAKQPKAEVKPTAQQKANAEMSVQIAQMKQEQAKLNAQLTLDIAMLKKQMKAETPSTQEG